MLDPSEDEKEVEPDVQVAHWALAGYQVVSTEFFAHLALTVATFVPQLGLVGFLLTSPTRVGSFLWIGVFLGVSDALTVYFALRTLVDGWNVRITEREMVKRGLVKDLREIEESPSIIKRFADLYDHPFIDSNRGIATVLAAIVVFVLGTSSYITWLWYHP